MPRRPDERLSAPGQVVDRLVAAAPLLIALALVAWIFSLNPNLMSPVQLEIKANALVTLILLAAGQTIVIIAGGIDLSVAGILSVANVLAATQMTEENWPLVVVALIGFGVAAGCLNAAIVIGLRISPFMATLAMWSVWAGVAQFVLPFSGGAPARAFTEFIRAEPAGIPGSVVIIIAVAVWWLWFKRTASGVEVYAIGGDERASTLSGMPVVRTKILAFALCGAFAALAGIYRTVQIGSADADAGNGLLLPAIVAVVVGGASLAGGSGGVVMTMIGAVIVLSVTDLVFFLGIQTFYTPMFQGLFLVAAVALNAYARRRAAARAEVRA